MSNLEHLVENGLYTLKKCDDYDGWLKQMRKDPNWEGIERLTIDDLWEICQYIYCRGLDELSIYIAEQTEPKCTVPFDEMGFCEHFNCDTCKCECDMVQTEPQTELVNDSPILVKDLVDDEFNPYDEECMRCNHLKLKCEFVPSYCKYEPRNEQSGKE